MLGSSLSLYWDAQCTYNYIIYFCHNIVCFVTKSKLQESCSGMLVIGNEMDVKVQTFPKL